MLLRHQFEPKSFLDVRDVEKPDLNRIWETYVRIGNPNETSNSEHFKRLVRLIRFKVRPMLSDLRQKKIIGWYSFLVHRSRQSGDPNYYWHIRFELNDDTKDREYVNSILPIFCEKDKTARCMDVEDIETIRGIDKSLLRNEEIEEAWRVLGEQSEWLSKMLDAYKEDVDIPVDQIEQILHFYSNMTLLSRMRTVSVTCPICHTGFYLRRDMFFRERREN